MVTVARRGHQVWLLIALVGAVSLVLGYPAPAGAAPAPALCSMDVSRGSVPDGFAVEACVDSGSVWVRNNLPVPVQLGTEGDTGTPARVSIDYGVAASLTRRVYSSPLLLLPNDLIRIPIGNQSATVKVLGTDGGGFYALAWTVVNALPGKTLQVTQALTDLIVELDDSYRSYDNCMARAGTKKTTKAKARRAACKVLLKRDVTVAIGRGGVKALVKGILAPIISGVTWANWASKQPGAVLTVANSAPRIQLQAVGQPAPAQPAPAPIQPAPVSQAPASATSVSIVQGAARTGGWYIRFNVSSGPPNGLIGCQFSTSDGKYNGQWQRNIQLDGSGNGSSASQEGTGTTWIWGFSGTISGNCNGTGFSQLFNQAPPPPPPPPAPSVTIERGAARTGGWYIRFNVYNGQANAKIGCQFSTSDGKYNGQWQRNIQLDGSGNGSSASQEGTGTTWIWGFSGTISGNCNGTGFTQGF